MIQKVSFVIVSQQFSPKLVNLEYSTVTGDSSVSLRTHILSVNNIYWLFEAHILLLCRSYSSRE